MDWAAYTPAEAAVRGAGGYSCVVPPGSILPFVGEQPPPGFLLCDGRAIPKMMYPKLHEAIGDAYGVSQRFRVRHFHLPDLRARSVRMAEAGMEDHWSSPTEPTFSYVIRS